MSEKGSVAALATVRPTSKHSIKPTVVLLSIKVAAMHFRNRPTMAASKIASIVGPQSDSVACVDRISKW